MVLGLPTWASGSWADAWATSSWPSAGAGGSIGPPTWATGTWASGSWATGSWYTTGAVVSTTRPAILGTMRLGNARLAYESPRLAIVRAARVRILVGGVLVTNQVRKGSVTIRDVLNDAPNTCTLVMNGSAPTVDQALRITVNSDTPRLLFNGAFDEVGLTYEGKATHLAYACHAIDDTLRANHRLPFGSWTNVSATTVATEIVTTFCPGFTAVHVQAGLPPVSVNLDGSEGVNGAMTQLSKLIGGYFYWEDYDFHLFTTEVTDAPATLDSTPGRFRDDPPIKLLQNTSQLRTRILGIGHGEATLSEVLAGDSIIPIANTVMFNPAGGLAISETQRLTYAAAIQGGAGALVGPGASPSSALFLTGTDGAGGTVDAGTHQYAFSYVTAAGESLVGPLASIVTGQALTPPTAAPQYAGIGAGALTAGYYGYATTFVTAAGQTTSTVRNVIHSSGTSGLNLNNIITGPSNVINRKVYRTAVQTTAAAAATAQLKLLTTLADNVTTTFGDNVPDGSLGANVPTSNTAILNEVNVAGISIGPAAVTSRKLYRTVAGGSQPKLVTTIANNTATTFLDTVADASLGANNPVSDTSGLAQPTGLVPAGFTSLVVASTGAFSSTGGWAVIGNGTQVIRYTGITANALSGIPPSGPGAIVASVAYNSTATTAPVLSGVTGLVRGLINGAPVNLMVQRDDPAAQAELIARETMAGRPSDGIIEHRIIDQRRGEASLSALCDADLALFGRPLKTVPYACYDINTKSGKPIIINNPGGLAINETLTIQDVTITDIDVYDGVPPKFTALASSVRFSLEDLLRKMSALLGGA